MDQTPELPPHMNKVTIKSAVSDDDYCPELPLYLKKKCDHENEAISLPTQAKKKIKSDSLDSFCPELPPHLSKCNTTDEDDLCPELPSHLQKVSGKLKNSSSPKVQLHKKNVFSCTETDNFCPKLPPLLQKIKNAENLDSENKANFPGQNRDNEDEEIDEFCPALPPHLTNALSKRLVGPSLPPSDYKPDSHSNLGSLSDDTDDDKDDTVYGPMPSSQAVDVDRYIEERIEQHTNAMKNKITGKDVPHAPIRDSWMLELPEDRPLFAGLGLQARQFARRSKTDRGDTSVWTDTPADRERKAKRRAERGSPDKDEPEAPSGVSAATQERDSRLQQLVEQYNATARPAPLVDTHRAATSSVTGSEGEKTSLTGVGRERKPFSREEDLHVNKFDEAQRTSILKKAKQLNDRFASGKTSKFL